MRHDAKKLRVPFPESQEWMLDGLRRLIEANNASNATLRIAVVRNRGGLFEGPNLPREFDLFAFTADLTHWSAWAKLGLKANARSSASEFSGTKVTSWAFNLNWYEEAHERGLDELVLLNERGEVSECTSANIFAVYGSEAVTPPLSSGCLAGITRAIFLEEIHIPGISLGERVLKPEDLSQAEEVFLTSSTRDLMPVESVEGLTIGTKTAVGKALGEAFTAYRTRYRQ
jgi:branched-chain amino acid aminotransferase